MNLPLNDIDPKFNQLEAHLYCNAFNEKIKKPSHTRFNWWNPTNLFRDAVQIYIVNNLFLNQTIIDNFFFREPDINFSLRFLRFIGTMN